MADAPVIPEGDFVSGTLVDLNGTRLYVDDRGEDSAPALLYIHGGPGLGCYDFMHVQGDPLARTLRVIGVDQRGVLRSDALHPGDQISVDRLIDDFEDIRGKLGIRQWAILGHSAGGGYAIEYATQHPESVTAAIFDCPCWDCDLTDRYRLPVAAKRLMALGRTEAAEACMALGEKATRITVDDGALPALQQLGEAYAELFFFDRNNAVEHGRILEDSGLTEGQWQQGSSHLSLMAAMYQSRLHLLAALQQPSLLLHGRRDLVTPPVVIDRFRRDVRDGSVHTFEQSSHFSYMEQAREYSDVVATFVTAHASLTNAARA
jgi:proline iminopeptidase